MMVVVAFEIREGDGAGVNPRRVVVTWGISMARSTLSAGLHSVSSK